MSLVLHTRALIPSTDHDPCRISAASQDHVLENFGTKAELEAGSSLQV